MRKANDNKEHLAELKKGIVDHIRNLDERIQLYESTLEEDNRVFELFRDAFEGLGCDLTKIDSDMMNPEQLSRELQGGV